MIETIAPAITVKKGFSLYQPYSNLITLKFKTGETRMYIRKFRGELLICAAKKVMSLAECRAIMTPNQYARLINIQVKTPYDIFGPVGVAQCVAKVVDWRPMNKLEDIENTFVDWHPNRCVAVLENIRPVVTFKLKGRQGLFNLTPEEQAQIEFGN